ncbi:MULTISPECIES: (d)CMP kinase [Enterococcus]|uniref:Cytidylate kinase n=1 Tax=Candidatus Enterococcus mangumiae TaxID=2230878 RepID=A0ABZ2SYB7_9ENTE|nr:MULTISPECIES: (d)CMP kinase [unclassified Enterococcus]MBO0491290.1 (d)CMP kinase [Enterococcus sp. DIV1094]MBO1301171.1 (d)CMP kinase [Enterococcus sp. DIV1271a]
MTRISIAIDGPASSGKSTVAKIIANELNYIYTDTGAMYRAVTYLAIKHQVAFSDETGLVDLINQYPISFEQQADGQHVLVAGQDVTSAIRQPDVTRAVSEVAAHSNVRKALVSIQQRIGEDGGVVMDGRDIGTAVLPKAEVKIFLVASVTERAQRRHKENLEKNIPTDLEELTKEIQARDEYDSTRKVSPLKQADDAIRIDTTGKSIPEVVQEIKEVINQKGYCRD